MSLIIGNEIISEMVIAPALIVGLFLWERFDKSFEMNPIKFSNGKPIRWEEGGHSSRQIASFISAHPDESGSVRLFRILWCLKPSCLLHFHLLNLMFRFMLSPDLIPLWILPR